MKRTPLPVYTHSACLGHEPGPGHPERPERLGAVVQALGDGLGDDLDWREAPRATRGQLLRVHAPRLLEAVLAPVEGHAMLDPDTVVSPGSAEAALRAAGAAVAAVDCVLLGEAPAAFCAVRPPGHHATASEAMGFCLFNNVAVAAAQALERHGLARVSIVDFDVHHGNGTQAIFEADARVQYVSSHQVPLFPDSGSGRERGVGNIFNAGLAPGSAGDAFRALWQDRLLPAIDAFAPNLLLVSAGFDGHARDPLADLRLQAGDYAWLTAQLRVLAARHCRDRMVSMLEGGYDLEALAACSLAHVEALLAPDEAGAGPHAR